MEYSPADTRKFHWTGYGNFRLMNSCRPKVAPVPTKSQGTLDLIRLQGGGFGAYCTCSAGKMTWRHLLGRHGGTVGYIFFFSPFKVGPLCTPRPLERLPVTKVKTPFMKAFDWHTAYSSSPWDGGGGVYGSVPFPLSLLLLLWA